jgi:hypothetical protein
MVILKCIGLPENIREPIERFHQNRGTAGRDPVALRALALAENYANGLLLASSESSPISPVPEKDWAALSGQTRLAAPDGEEIRSQVYCLTAILSRLNSADQAGLTKFPYKKSKARVWLARDPFFCSADPLAAALRELASVKLQDRLPTALELCDVSALVVESRGKDRPSLNRQSIEYCLQANVKIPLLWLVNESSTAPAGSTLEPVQAVTLRTIEDFVGRALPLAPIVAA